MKPLGEKVGKSRLTAGGSVNLVLICEGDWAQARDRSTQAILRLSLAIFLSFPNDTTLLMMIFNVTSFCRTSILHRSTEQITRDADLLAMSCFKQYPSHTRLYNWKLPQWSSFILGGLKMVITS